jgi:uncharacterized membrane protein
MRRSSRILLLGGVIAIAIVSAIVLTGVFVNFNDPAFQRALLRLLAVIGVVAMLAMSGSLLMRTETIDQLASQPVQPRRPRR